MTGADRATDCTAPNCETEHDHSGDRAGADYYDRDGRPIPTAPYGWTVDIDHLAGTSAVTDAGTTGPWDISNYLQNELDEGQGRTFRIYDDDGEIYYTGRIVSVDGIGRDGEPVDGDEETVFGPLNDYGAPNAGATEIHYLTARGWEIV